MKTDGMGLWDRIFRETISAAEFWDHYFRDHFIELERHTDRYDGAILLDRGTIAALMRKGNITDITISTSDLRAFDYRSDSRFRHITKVSRWDIAEAYAAVEDGTYPHRSPGPYGPKKLAQLLKRVRSTYRLGKNREIRLPALQSILAELVATYTPSIAFPIAALAWFLGERRDRTSGEVLTSILADSNYLGGIISSTVTEAALSALWKSNAKLQLPRLVQLMRRANHAGQWDIAALLSRLLSTDVMLSPSVLGKSYERPGYWEALIAKANAKTQADWDRYDVNTLYWEIRYLAALCLPAHDVANRAKLAKDVVGPVADAARGYG